MKSILGFMLSLTVFGACHYQKEEVQIEGTWQLISGTIIEQGDTTVTDYTKEQEFIKIIKKTKHILLF